MCGIPAKLFVMENHIIYVYILVYRCPNMSCQEIGSGENIAEKKHVFLT